VFGVVRVSVSVLQSGGTTIPPYHIAVYRELDCEWFGDDSGHVTEDYQYHTTLVWWYHTTTGRDMVPYHTIP
jgi:hypothetical protein